MLKKTLLLLSITFVASVIAVGVMQWQRWHAQALPVSETTIIEVESGTPLNRLAERLEAECVIEHAWDLKLLARIQSATASIQAGEYAIEPGMTLAILLDQLVRGAVRLHSLTIVEGMSFRQLQQAVRAHEALRHTLNDDDGYAAAVMAAIGHEGEHPEGRFLPETWHFPRGMTDVEFYRRAADALDTVLQQAWENRAADLPYDDAYDALIMASIIEKETAVPDERNEIAGVFVRRLKRNMRLQTDPTVIYGLGESYTGDIRYRDLRTDTPYNTYTRSGLPPTPIAMPGRASIEAAMHPAEGDTLYFVATEGGRHHFSTTLEEHNRMVRKYQMTRRPLDNDKEDN